MAAWRLITTWAAAPDFNMGLDEALLATPGLPPTVRFYSWKPDTLSLGYFQKLADVPGHERASKLVRRITGGGAIHHVRELTFSISADLSLPLYANGVSESYARVHRAIARALAEFGVEARLRGADALRSDRPGSGMCFHHSTELDLVWDEMKGVGSAQRRKAGRVLHHGSIKLGSSALEGEIATLESRRRGLTPAAFAPALKQAFEAEFEVELEASVPEADERELAKELGPRYLDADFVRSR
ncbi:MAG TPA: biotin/lipoate A/B protein ligase family protein [Planctomycetota bacterium]|nr:biotin/lipoate A/B protein ligase family protein [Planctomycetota bacterium]